MSFYGEDKREAESEAAEEYSEEGDYEEYQTCQLTPGDREKTQLLSIFGEMRKDSTFCDVAFLCRGQLFRAHRVVVSSWSRWLRSLLSEASRDDVVSLDVFEAPAFSAVLDYMYGMPLEVTLETADSIIKVVRRLEMQKLEQQCWRYLMTILDPETNCEVLHELADRYDCPPLKLAAWRVLQETIPGYSVSPDKFIQPKRLRKLSDTVVKKGFDHGFTGPGDAAYSSNSINGLHIKHGQSAIQSDDEDASVAADMPSLFDNKTRSRSSYRARPAEDGTQSLAEALEESELQEGEEDESTGDIPENYTRPEELSADASASEVVQAWSYRLREVYNACMSYDGDQYQDRESFHLANKPNTRILKYPRHPGKGREEKDSQNGSVQNFDEGEEDNLIRTRPPITSATRPKSMSPMKGKGHQQIGIEKLIDWREELKRFYVSINMAEKIASISTILQQWEGKEEQMLSSLAEKYKNQIPSHMMMHINQLIGILESQTESSFINQVR